MMALRGPGTWRLPSRQSPPFFGGSGSPFASTGPASFWRVTFLSGAPLPCTVRLYRIHLPPFIVPLLSLSFHFRPPHTT